MSIEEIWEIKEETSKATKGKTAAELRKYFKPAVDEFNAEIEKIRRRTKVGVS